MNMLYNQDIHISKDRLHSQKRAQENIIIVKIQQASDRNKSKIHVEYYLITRMIKNKIFKQGIGIAENSQETRRDHWGGNVNHKCLFWLSDP